MGCHPVGELELVGMRKIKCYCLRPDRETGYISYISDSLKNLQTFVGGYIEVWGPFNNWKVICNEEGRLRGMEYCCTVMGEEFFGPVLIVGVNGEEFDDIPFPDVHILRGLLGVK